MGVCSAQRSRIVVAVVAAAAATSLAMQSASAQHAIDIQRETAQGEYLRALVMFDRMPKRQLTPDAVLAAARSAWALGLSSRAAEELERVVREGGLSAEEEAKAILSRGVIEYQEGRYQVAALFAERAVARAAGNPGLQSRGYLLWGESLYALSSFAQAEKMYLEASSRTTDAENPELRFLLATCQRTLGKYSEARANLEQIPVTSERAPQAMRALAELALESGEFDIARFWLQRGRSDFPDNFLDSWVDYALMAAAIHGNDSVEVRALREAANTRYPPSDQWLTLLNAAAEAFEWQPVVPEAAPPKPQSKNSIRKGA